MKLEADELATLLKFMASITTEYDNKLAEYKEKLGVLEDAYGKLLNEKIKLEQIDGYQS